MGRPSMSKVEEKGRPGRDVNGAWPATNDSTLIEIPEVDRSAAHVMIGRFVGSFVRSEN